MHREVRRVGQGLNSFERGLLVYNIIKPVNYIAYKQHIEPKLRPASFIANQLNVHNSWARL